MSVSKPGAKRSQEIMEGLLFIAAVSGPEKKARGKRMRQVNKTVRRILQIIAAGTKQEAENEV